MPFHVRISRRADRDLDDQLKWWSRHDRRAAEEWRERFLSTVIESLESDPEVYPAADEAAEMNCDLRMMRYGKRRQSYRVLFTIEGKTVIIQRVRHTAQDYLTADDI